MTPVPDADLRELGGSNLTDPDFPRRGAAPDPDVRFVRSRYRLFRRYPGTDLWACACGRESCWRNTKTWADLSGAYQLWAVSSELLDRLVPVLRWTGAHFGTAPGVEPAPWSEVLDCGPARPAVVSNYSDLSAAQRSVLLGRRDASRIPSRATVQSLAERGLLKEDRFNPGEYLLTAAGTRARRLLSAGEDPDPPGISEPRAPRTWRLNDPDPGEEGLEVADCDGDVWRRHGGRWSLVEWASGQPVHPDDESSTWSIVVEYAPLTERLHRDLKRGRPTESSFREELAELHAAVSLFFVGRASLPELRKARAAATRALGLSPGSMR